MLPKLKKYSFKNNQITNIPEEYGVYIFFSEKKPLYVGKSVNLRTRIKSYKSSKLTGKTFKLISQTTKYS